MKCSNNFHCDTRRQGCSEKDVKKKGWHYCCIPVPGMWAYKHSFILKCGSETVSAADPQWEFQTCKRRREPELPSVVLKLVLLIHLLNTDGSQTSGTKTVFCWTLDCSVVSAGMVMGNSSVPVLAVTKTLGDPPDAVGEVGDLSN